MVLIYNPRQTILVSCRGTGTVLGITNEHNELFPCDWHMPVSHEPAIYAVAVSKVMTFALEVIRESGHFVVNFMSIDYVEKVKKCGFHEGKFLDKFKESGLEIIESSHIDAPRVLEAVGFLECEIIKELDEGDHVLFLGKVLNSKLNDALAKRIFHVDGEEYTSTK